MGLICAERAIPKYEDRDKERHYFDEWPYLYITVITQESFRTVS
jgi:hypothetical protein